MRNVTADLFWQWNPSPGALIPVERAGPWTITPSNGGGFYVLWYYDSVRAHGTRATVEKALSVALSSTLSPDAETLAALAQQRGHLSAPHVQR